MSAANSARSRRPLRFRQQFRTAAAAAGALLAVAGAAAAETGEVAFARHDYPRAAAIFRVEATRGRATAQTYLGYLLFARPRRAARFCARRAMVARRR